MERAAEPLLSFGSPAEGGPPCPHGPVAGKAAASTLGGRQSACDPGRATRPVAPATTPSAAMLASHMGGSRLQTTGRQSHADKTATPLAIHWACLMAEAPLTLAWVAPPRRRGPRPGGPHGHNSLIVTIPLYVCTPLWPHRARPTATKAVNMIDRYQDIRLSTQQKHYLYLPR